MAPVTRSPGSASGTCFAGSHSPCSPPFAPLAPPQLPPPQTAPQGGPLCSPASQLLWRSPTSRARASSATAPHLPDADQVGTWPVVRRGISRFQRDPFARDVAFDPGGTTMPRIAALHMLRSTMKTCPSRARPYCVEENKMSYHIEINEYQRRLIMKALTSTDVNQFSQAPGSGDAFDTEAKRIRLPGSDVSVRSTSTIPARKA